MHDLLWLLAEGGPNRKVLDVLYLLAAAAVVAVGSRRLRLPTIPGYLIVGAIVGPHALKIVGTDESIQEIGELAIILLMFTIGMHMDLDGIRSGMVRILSVGLISTILVVGVGVPVGMAFGLSAPVALTIAMALSMSSTAVALGVLNQRREMHLLHGRLAVGIELVQDLLSVAVLGSLPAIAVWAGAKGVGIDHDQVQVLHETGLSHAIEVLSNGLLKFGGLGVFLALARYVLPRLLKEASHGGGAEQLLVVSAAVALGAAGLTWTLGFGPVLGAFLAGFMLAATPFRYQLAGQLSPLRDLFMAVFFTSVGMTMDLGQVTNSWWIILIGLAVLLVVKTAAIGFTTWACGATAAVSASVAFLLGQAGEFSLVVFGEAAKQGILSSEIQGIVIAITVLSLVVASPWYDLASRLHKRLQRIPTARWVATHTLRDHFHLGQGRPPTAQEIATAMLPGSGGVAGPRARAAGHEPSHPDHELPAAPEPGHAPGHAAQGTANTRHVIIAGFGVVGRNLAEHFAAASIQYTVVELNSNTVRKQASLGRKTVYGDISNPDVLEQAGIHTAEAVILTIPDDEATLRACQAVRAVAPEVFIAARTSYLSKAIAATELGADYVTVEEVVTAQDMAKHVMSRLHKRMNPTPKPAPSPAPASPAQTNT